MTTERVWTVEDHLELAPPEHVALYRRLETMILACGPVRFSPSKTTITFKGARRGFLGGRPTPRGVAGYIDLMRSAVEDPRVISSSPYTGRLHVNQFRLTGPDDLDDTFADLIREAYRVGQGEHLL